jgi:PAS domain S-box-containing protein
MKTQRETSLRIRLAGLAIIALFIVLAAAAYFSGEQVKRSSALIATDAVPGVIFAHDMRMAMSRSVGYMMVAASAQTTQSRDASIKVAHDADVAFTNAVAQYKTTIIINPAEDESLLNEVTSRFAEFQRQRMTYEALILAGNHDGSAAFLETNLVPAYVAAIQPAEDLLKYNNGNSITYANYIRNSVHRLYWAVAVVMVLALVCAAVLVVNFAIRRREMEQLKMLKASIDKHFDGAFWMDANNQFVYVNDTACKVLGYTREELLGKPVTMIAPSATPQILERVWKGLRETGFFTRESIHRRKDGSQFPIELVASYVRSGDKEFNCSFARDITERRLSQDELVWKTALLEAQVDATLDGILVVDTMGKKILQNQRFLEMFKVPDEIARDDDDANMLQHAASQMKNPQQFRERVINLYGHPDEIGREEIELADGMVFDRYSAPVRNKAGKHFGRIWTFRDITDQKKLEQQFRQAQKMEAVGQLASGVAHDFNNILGIIQMQSDMLKTEGTLSPAQSGYASEIGEAVERAAALTRQLLLFGRKEKMQARELDLNQSINDMTKMLRRTLGGNIELQFKFSMQPLFVNADAGMIDQVLMNLAVNARDAMPKGGKIVIEASAVIFDESIKDQYVQASAGSFVCLSVSDTGSGIPPEILPKIFEPFFTTKDVGKGTGLGLATVFGIVQQHKGWINVYSEIGQGTTFRIYIPRLAKISDQKFVAPLTEPASGGNETILVVEDEPKLRASVINMLSRLGYNVLEAHDGANALEVWKQQRDVIHLLLTDLVMPGGINGKELGERLLKENPKLKVIYASGYSTDVAARDFPLEEGVNFLSKPFQAQKLARIVRERLDAKI